jgi:hypothetical protein
MAKVLEKAIEELEVDSGFVETPNGNRRECVTGTAGEHEH